MKLEVWKRGEYGKKEILKIATLKRACTPQGIYVISSEGLPRILERSPGYAGGYLTLCIRALFPAVTGYTGCPRAKEMSLACDHARFLVISDVRPMCKASNYSVWLFDYVMHKREVVESEIFRVEVTMQMIHG